MPTTPPRTNEEIAHHIYESLLDKGAIYDETSDIIIPKIIEALDAKDEQRHAAVYTAIRQTVQGTLPNTTPL